MIIHIVAGALALFTGSALLVRTKGTSSHRRAGWRFVAFMVVVVLTGITGVVIFRQNLFLLVLTTLVGYNTYSGVRIARTKSNKVRTADVLVIISAVVTTLYFLYYLKAIGFYWNPVITYATVGYLFLVTGYDIFRYLIPESRYGNLWKYEHSCKMISALGGLLSAFTGTVLPGYKPYSQFMPSCIMTLVMIIFIIKIRQESKRGRNS